MALITFEDLPSTNTPINATNLNKIQEGNIYSTNEVEIGKWIDNKPIYRKIIKFIPNTKDYDFGGVNITANTLDTLVKCEGIFKRTSSNYRNLLPGNYTGWETYLYDISATYGKIKFSDNQWNAGVDYVVLIFEYTKTTD